MRNWKAELDALFADTTAFAQRSRAKPEQAAPHPREIVAKAAFPPVARGSEYEEIRKRVLSFRAHQQRFIREREEYAASMLRKMRAVSSASH
jgi:hypothetical protein